MPGSSCAEGASEEVPMQVLQTAAVHDSGEGSSSEPYGASQPVLGPAFQAEDFYTRLLRLQKGVDAVKHILQQRGHNLANTQDIYGRTFKLPVDLDHVRRGPHTFLSLTELHFADPLTLGLVLK
eukprot:6173935-Pleurochrysis_carterae.AAC.1